MGLIEKKPIRTLTGTLRSGGSPDKQRAHLGPDSPFLDLTVGFARVVGEAGDVASLGSVHCLPSRYSGKFVCQHEDHTEERKEHRGESPRSAAIVRNNLSTDVSSREGQCMVEGALTSSEFRARV